MRANIPGRILDIENSSQGVNISARFSGWHLKVKAVQRKACDARNKLAGRSPASGDGVTGLDTVGLSVDQ
jgi:hypothetical protein